MQQLFYLGIDVSKKSLAAFLTNDSSESIWRNASLGNDENGFKRLYDRVLERAGKKCQNVSGDFKIVAGMEATGIYGEKLAAYLHDHNVDVYVLNPFAVSSFADAMMLANKNDRVDAGVIASYLKTVLPTGRERIFRPSSQEERSLRELCRRRSALVKLRTSEKNRLEKIRYAAFFPDCVAESMTSHLAQLDVFIADVEREIETLIQANADSSFGKRLALLRTIPGVGKVISAVIESETRGVDAFKSKKALVSFAGIAPSEHTSGTSVHKKTKINRRGSSRLRHALYLAVLSAVQHNPVIKDYYIKLQKQGEKKESCFSRLYAQVAAYRLGYV